jgi:hypothetical protein
MTEHVQKTLFRETSDKLSEDMSSRSDAAVSKLHAHVAVAVLPPEYVARSVFPSNAVFTMLLVTSQNILLLIIVVVIL